MAAKREWHDDDSFWRAFDPVLFPETSFQAAARNVGALLKLAKPKGRAVLDQGCGPGRYAIPLAKRGFQVTGIDRTRYFLDKGRARARKAGARKAGARLEWVRADMRRFTRPETFDLAINMFTSFGYFTKEAENFAVLENLHASLRPGGVCVLELMGKEVLARIWQTMSVQEAGGATLISRRRILGDWDRIWNEWTLIRRGRATVYAFDHALYSGKELKSLAGDAGFSEIRLHGSIAGEPYDLDAKRLVLVARKPRPRASRAHARRSG